MKAVKIIDCVKFERIGGYVIKAKIMGGQDPIHFSFIIENNLNLIDFIDNLEKLIRNLENHV